MPLILRVVTAALLSLSALTADAAIVTFTSRSAFDANFAGSVRENWDGFANGTVITNGSSVNGITYTSNVGDLQVTSAFLPSSTPNTLGLAPDDFFIPGDTVTFTFDAPVLAFGIDVSTGSKTSGDYSATTNLGDVALSVYDPFAGSDPAAGQFIGFSSDTAFLSVTITSGANFGYVLDTLRAVDAPAPVPEPGSLALAGLALLGLGVAARARRS